LRPGVADGQAQRLPPDQLAELVEVNEFRRRDGRRDNPGQQPELIEDAHGMGQEVDADPERANRLDGLKHPGFNPDLMEA
jgi:hypothetical protein